MPSQFFLDGGEGTGTSKSRIIVLKENGIEAFVFASASSGLGVSLSGGTIGVPLQVRQEDVSEAKQVLTANKRDSIDIDWGELELAGQGFLNNETNKPTTMRLPAKIAFAVTAIVALVGISISLILSIFSLF